jgi:hypothetical protein
MICQGGKPRLAAGLITLITAAATTPIVVITLAKGAAPVLLGL